MTIVSNADGTRTAELHPTLPSEISVTVDGVEIVAPATVSDKGNVWYEADVLAPITSERPLEEILMDAGVTFQGKEIPVAGSCLVNGRKTVTLSSPMVYGKNHPRRGQVVPNTGGKPKMSFFEMLPGWGDPEKAKRGYQVTITLKGVINKQTKAPSLNVRVSCQTAIQGNGKPARPPRHIGRVNGDLTF